jgi:predicted TIM-barrel fold metal-dependent hydrolase
MNRFDSLVHVTRNGAWLNGRDDASLRRLLDEMDRGQVDRACLVGLPGVVDNPYLLECAASSDQRLVPVAGVDPRDATANGRVVDEMRALAQSGFRGIKLHPRLGGYDPLDARVVDVMRAAGEAGLVVFLDTLFRQRAHATPSAADIVDGLARQCPTTTIVALHGGGAELLALAQVVKAHPNLVLDLSYTILAFSGSSVDLDLAWVLRQLDRRVIIGSDMPEFTPLETFARFDALTKDLSEEKRANVAYRNLAQLFPASAGAM